MKRSLPPLSRVARVGLLAAALAAVVGLAAERSHAAPPAAEPVAPADAPAPASTASSAAAAPAPRAPASSAAAPAPATRAPATDDAPITVTTRVSPEPSRIGDRLQLRVIAAYPAGYSVNLPGGLELPGLHVIETRQLEAESGGQGLKKRFEIDFQVFELGEQRTPAFELTYLDPEGGVHTLRVPPHDFRVEALTANEVVAEAPRRGEDPPIALEYPNDRAETRVLAAALGALLGALLLALWWRWRRRERLAEPAAPVPAHTRAFAALDALERRLPALVESGELPEVYLRLTEILKGYLEQRFGFEALDRTTDELRRLLESRGRAGLAELDPRELVRFLQDCDLVKFARFTPPAEEATQALAELRELVERSKLVESEADATSSGDGDDDGEAPRPDDRSAPPDDPSSPARGGAAA